jgi:hypothetical protein
LASKEIFHAGLHFKAGAGRDGATYHSARSARDRDRLRQTVLESLGWKIHRICSTAWFRDPEKELNALEDAIEDAKKLKAQVNISTDCPRVTVKHSSPTVQHVKEAPPPLSRTGQSALNYRFANIDINLGHLDLHEVAREQLANWLAQVIAVETSIHWLEATRRIADSAGIQRVRSRIQRALQGDCIYRHNYKKFQNRKGSLWTFEPSAVQVRDRSDFLQQQRKIDLVAPEEIFAAIEQTVEQSFGMEAEDVAIATLRLLGLARVSGEIRAIVEEHRDSLLNNGELELRGKTLVLNRDRAL